MIGGSCGTYGGMRGLQRVWRGYRMERDYLEDLSVDGRIILK